jgi:TonB family protein
MTTSVAVIEGGRMSFEPNEITYRSIMYYLDEKMMKMAQPSPSTVAATNPTNSNPQPKSTPTTPQPLTNNTAKKSVTSVPASTVSSDQLKNLDSSTLNKPTLGVQTSSVQVETEPPPPVAPRRILKPVSGGVLNGTAMSLPAPTYPDSARRMRVAGVVTVEVVVDETGKVISAQATSGPAALRDVAVQAALKARFSPTKLSGQPVKVSGVINYKFALAS